VLTLNPPSVHYCGLPHTGVLPPSKTKTPVDNTKLTRREASHFIAVDIVAAAIEEDGSEEKKKKRGGTEEGIKDVASPRGSLYSQRAVRCEQIWPSDQPSTATKDPRKPARHHSNPHNPP
jgi:hypothetical protein